jgi:DNA-binding NarL/FixJ family response regulator
MTKRTMHKVVDSKFGLTDIELKIVRAMCEGRSTVGVAAVVSLSVHTVRDKMRDIYKKMGVYSQVVMALRAERAGLLDGVNV